MKQRWPLSGLQRNALSSLVHFVSHTTKWTRGASALRWTPRGGCMLPFSCVPCLVSVLFTGPSLLEMKFAASFSPSFCSFWRVLNQLSNTTCFTFEYDITLQTNAFIASNEIVSVTHHLEHAITLQTHAFIASNRDSLCYSLLNTITWCTADKCIYR